MSAGLRRPKSWGQLLAASLLLAPFPVVAQSRTIGVVEYYGLDEVTRATLDSALRLRPGDTIPTRPADQAAVVRRLTAVPNVRAARLESVCCEDGRWILYVGIVERFWIGPTFPPRPGGRFKVADTLRALSDSFTARMIEGIRAGQAGDDLTQGHSLLSYPPARAIQEAVLGYSATHVDELREVLRSSGDDASRAIAAWALGYAPDKRSVIPDLVGAAKDPYDEVRNNAIRALAAIGVLASAHPELGLAVPAVPMIGLLHSPVWTDRNKTSLALLTLTQGRDTALLGLLRRNATGPLVEMARWHTGHALAPYLVVARIRGVSDSAALAAFQQGKRDSILGPPGN